jgi:hypothetical protein
VTREPLPPGVADLIDRRVSSTELQEALEHPLTSSEREETLSLVRWFCRRYQTPLERLAYTRQAYARWLSGRRGHRGGPFLHK